MDDRYIEQLLEQVASTSGYSSVQKADELLNYVTHNSEQAPAWNTNEGPPPLSSTEGHAAQPIQETHRRTDGQ